MLPTFADWYDVNTYHGEPPGKTLARPTYRVEELRGEATYTELGEPFADRDLIYTIKEELTQPVVRTHPLVELNFAPFHDRSALILANIDAVFMLTYNNEKWDQQVRGDEVEARYSDRAFTSKQVFDTTNEPPAPRLQAAGVYYVVDLGGVSGGAIEYLKWRRPQLTGFGLAIEPYDTRRVPPRYFTPTQGNVEVEDTVAAFVQAVRKKVRAGVNLVVTQRVGNEQAMVGQVVTALLTLGGQGDFVLAINDTTTLLAAQVLQYLADLFETVTIIKPTVVDPSSSTVYVIGKRMIGQGVLLKGIIEQLLGALRAWGRGVDVTSLFPEEGLAERWVEYLTDTNTEILEAQLEAIRWRTGASEEQLPSYHLDRAWRIWYLPEPPPPRQKTELREQGVVREERPSRGRGGSRGGSRGGGRGGSRGRGRGGSRGGSATQQSNRLLPAAMIIPKVQRS